VSDRNPSAASDEAYVSHHFDAPPEIVFAAWTDPEQVTRWWAPREFEIPLGSVDIEPRVGGRFHLEMVEVSGPARFRYRAEIVELAEPELIVLKGEPIAGTDIEVTITRVELVAEGAGTRMTVTSGPFTRQSRENAQTGWGELVVNLERVLAAGPA
jgi:uncharacterized protein YndB with AHSA1/START domain